MLTITEWREYLQSQGLSEKEVDDVLEWFNPNRSALKKESWQVDKIVELDTWFQEFCDSIESSFGDVGSFLKLHYIPDPEKFVMEYAEYLMEDCGEFDICYCPSTKRIVSFRNS